jgi:hypothetical protein
LPVLTICGNLFLSPTEAHEVSDERLLSRL